MYKTISAWIWMKYSTYIPWSKFQRLVRRWKKVENLYDLYYELLYAVEKKTRGETRHQTALRYIQEAEQGSQDNSTKPTKESANK